MSDTFTASILSVYAGARNGYAVPPTVSAVVDVIVAAVNDVFECICVTAYGALLMSKAHCRTSSVLLVGESAGQHQQEVRHQMGEI